jgi:hypothetical protein
MLQARTLPLAVCTALIAILPICCSAQWLPNVSGIQPLGSYAPPPSWPAFEIYKSFEIAKMFDSFTSYEFGNPDPELPSPVSRLEFPLDQWWGGFKVGLRSPFMSLNGEVLINLTSDSRPLFQDSDWLQQGERWYLLYPLLWIEDWGPGNQKNIFSESECRLNPSYTWEISCDINLLGLAGTLTNFEFGPVFGYRHQWFSFTAHDGHQKYYPASQELLLLNTLDPLGPGIRTGIFMDLLSVDLPGDTIKFTQTYDHYYIGGKCRRLLPLGELRLAGLDLPQFIQVSAQADWAWVKAMNIDLHLLRGNRVTIEDTNGGAWHLGFNLAYAIPRITRLEFSGDFKKIDTSGTHLWQEVAEESMASQSWARGVRAWSDQMSFSGSLELFF